MDKLMEFFGHIDQHLGGLIDQYGGWVYVILFLILFCETGLIIRPALPGDSLLLAVWAVAAAGLLDIFIVVPMFVLASFLGSNTNYWIGRWIGPRAFRLPKSLLFNPRHLERAHRFYGKYGPGMMLFTRFVPVVRTFAPFTAGVGVMDYRKFLLYDGIGALLWSPSLILLGFWGGNFLFTG
jgi:membrane-associated protein